MAEKKKTEKSEKITKKTKDTAVVKKTDTVKPVVVSSTKKKATGATESLVSIFCYLGAFIAGAVVLKLSKQNRFIRFNAAQSTIFTLSAVILCAVLHVIPIIGSLLSVTLAIGGAGLWAIMIIKAIKHEEFRIPLVSYFADKLVDKIDQKALENKSN